MRCVSRLDVEVDLQLDGKGVKELTRAGEGLFKELPLTQECHHQKVQLLG